MNVNKLVVLGALEQIGGGSGYDILQALNQKMIDKWVDIKVGSIYYTIKQLLQDGMICEVAQVQERNYPPKVIYEITATGQRHFDELQKEAFRGLFPSFFGFKLALKFNTRKSSAEIEYYSGEALASIDRYLAAMDTYLATLGPDSPQYQYDAFFIEHDRRLFNAERTWITEAVLFMHMLQERRHKSEAVK